MLQLYWANAGQMDLRAPAPLSDYRKERLAKLKPEQARKSSLCAELLLIEAVKREEPAHRLPLEIVADENGKPGFSQGKPFFSLSHSGVYAACALASFPVGLDIQTLSNCHEALIRRFFTAGEQAEILSAEDRDAAFTRLWCRKESFLKAIGLGLRLDLRSFDVSGADPRPSYEGCAYAFWDHREGELFFSVCVPQDRAGEAFPPPITRLP